SGYALCHNYGKATRLIHVLIGAALTQVLDRTLEELIQQPDAPNLYWSLTVLPRPFLDYRLAPQGGDILPARTRPGLNVRGGRRGEAGGGRAEDRGRGGPVPEGHPRRVPPLPRA